MKQFDFCSRIRTHTTLLKKFSVLILIIFVLGTLMSKVKGQAVFVDKVDYMPGDVVKINGYSWQPGEVVSVVLTENYLNPEGKLITTNSFTCDSQGKFTGILYTVVEANLGAFFHVKATGALSNHVCTTVFHDAGGDYSIDYSAYDPEFYLRRTVTAFPKSGYFPLEGNIISPLGSGGTDGYTMHTHTVESLNPQFLGLGQIVAFEFYISADAGGACVNDKISFGGEWSTETQNGGNFGFDPAYMVIAAFVDPSAETEYHDGGTQASARILSNVVNGTDIEALFEVSGLDPGDKFPVEVWLVLKSSIASSVGSNVPTGTLNGLTLGTCETGEEVKLGKQTIPLLQAGDFYTTDVDVSVTKSDSQDPASIGVPFYYTITVINNGPSVANSIVLTDVLNSNLDVDVNTITFSHDISTGYADDPSWGHSFDISTNTMTLTKLSVDPGETIYIRIPVTWIPTYSGTKTAGAAGTGGAGLTCTGDLTNTVSMTTISDDTDSTNDSYCQPTNVVCHDHDASAGPDKAITCLTASVILDGSSTITRAIYSWTTIDGHIVSGDNTATPVVDAAGTYTLTITDPYDGCTATDFAVVTINTAVPDVNAGTDKVLTCLVTSVVLDGSSTTPGVSYLWTTSDGNIVSGANTAAPTVNAAGTYTLTVTNTANGCTATDAAAVTLNDAVPNVSAGLDKALTCLVTSVVLDGSSTTPGVSYLWTTSDGNIVSGANTAAPTVNAAGTYTLTVTNTANGCTATDAAAVTLNDAVPNVSAGLDKALTCLVTSVVLDGSSTTPGVSYLWTTSDGNIVSGANTAAPTVNAAGTYTLTVTNTANGCTATDAAAVTLNDAVPNVSAGLDKALTCLVTSVVLDGSSTTPGVSYLWTTSDGNIVSGANTAAPTVNAAGTYTLTVTNTANGCTATDAAAVTLNDAVPNVSAGLDKALTCLVTSVVLDGSSTTPGVSYLWTTSDGNIVSGANTAAPTVNAAGTYTLTVTNTANGCTATDAAAVTLNDAVPNVSAGLDKALTCLVTSVVLDGSSTTPGVSYLWTTSDGNIVSGANTAAPTVNAAGTYMLTVTNTANGCTATDAAAVTLNDAVPNVSAGLDKALTCLVTSVVLDGSSTTPGVSYLWTTCDGNIVSGANTAAPTVNAAGTYTLTVTNTANGCTATDAAAVTLNDAVPNVSAGLDKALTCLVTSVVLDGSSTTPGVSYLWTTSTEISSRVQIQPLRQSMQPEPIRLQ